MLEIIFGLLIMGGCVVFFSRSPSFGIFGVLLQALAFAGFICLLGLPFFGLLLVLIYIGGMLIVFLFSSLLSAERYPDSGWSQSLVFFFVFFSLFLPYIQSWDPLVSFLGYGPLIKESGLGELFGAFGSFTLLIACVLLIALVIVLIFSFQHSCGTLRKL